ncbi:MAG: phospho-sugar mutase [Clostridia bacterium]|nr:phospho-sugar mutase [Clostridia bacterium]
MSYNEIYESWLAFEGLDADTRAELTGLPESEIRERFYAPLAFGTAGLRGIMGAGINRMNLYTVNQTTQGLANVLNAIDGAAEKGVAISYDCRINSELFARSAASILAANGIRVRLFEGMRPTPELSFAIRNYGCAAGINVTASHNPKEYNGYKVYWSDGAQIDDEIAARVSAAVAACDIFTGVKTTDYAEAVAAGKIELLGRETDELFLAAAESCRLNADLTEGSDLSIVYTPFHGTGYKLVPEIFERIGLKNIHCVEAQMIPDGAFPTVKSPNPEEIAGFKLAIELAKETGSDLIIGTDPDADRVGLIVRKQDGEYVALTGNQVGILLSDYIIRARKERGTLPEKSVVISTVVTSLMARRVCEANGVRYGESFTGFRFIAELMSELEPEGYVSLLGFEESYGYMTGGHCRDKDAVTASMLIAEMAVWYERQGLTLYGAMERLYEMYGVYAERTLNLKFPGVDGLEAMRALMKSLRETPPTAIGGEKVTAIRDYLCGVRREIESGREETMALSNSNVLYFELADGCVLVIRPSGTEPKIKVYLLVKADTHEVADAKIERYTDAAEHLTDRED